jgi:hypothetical protein
VSLVDIGGNSLW